jgi:hypothetical protein
MIHICESGAAATDLPQQQHAAFGSLCRTSIALTHRADIVRLSLLVVSAVELL